MLQIRRAGYAGRMALKAVVRNGRLQLDYPADLPEGTEIDLVAADEVGAFSESELARINAAIDTATASIEAGQGVDGFDLIRKLRAAAR